MDKEKYQLNGMLICLGMVALVVSASAIATVITIFIGFAFAYPDRSIQTLGALASFLTAAFAALAAGLSWKAIKQTQEHKEIEIQAGAPNVIVKGFDISIEAEGKFNPITGMDEPTGKFYPYLSMEFQNIGHRPALNFRCTASTLAFRLQPGNWKHYDPPIMDTEPMIEYMRISDEPVIEPNDKMSKTSPPIDYDFLMDEKNNLLGIVEIETRYIDPHPAYRLREQKKSIVSKEYRTWISSFNEERDEVHCRQYSSSENELRLFVQHVSDS